jgi:hypothetical protein
MVSEQEEVCRMTFDFGKIGINVAWAEGVREREGAEFIEYNVTVKAPNVASFKTTTWKEHSSFRAEEKDMKDIAIAMMYTLAKAWSDPTGFIAQEKKTAKVFHNLPPSGIEEAGEKAVVMVHFASSLSSFMDDAIVGLWKTQRRDDQRLQRGPREWFPGKKE